MQEDIDHRAVTLVINTTKLTARTLKSAIAKYLAHRKHKHYSRDKPRKRRAHNPSVMPAAREKYALLIDIEAKLRAGKGQGYENWAKKYNLKQMARTMAYLQEHKLLDYGVLTQKADDAVERFHALSTQIRTAEKRMAEIAVLEKHIRNYSKTREVYTAYRKAGYSRKYLAEHESEIIIHKAAKKAFDDLRLAKLPTVRSLRTEYEALLSEKKAAYAEYRAVRDEMKELHIHRANVDEILNKARHMNRLYYESTI